MSDPQAPIDGGANDSAAFLQAAGPPPRGHDRALDAVAEELMRLDPVGARMAETIRKTLDQLLDGRRTGRYDYSQLLKTEKTHMGTLVEINLHREFVFEDGDATDYRIVGVQVDCKFSQRIGGWEIGPEIVGHVCLVVWASDVQSRWRAGVVRADDENLRRATNRDAKRRLNDLGISRIRWLWPEAQGLAENLLLHLDAEVRNRILLATGARSGRNGQARIFQLCREVQGRILRRAVVETVGWGLDDPLKRMRANGGARDALRSEGLLVLGAQDQDPLIACSLGIDAPGKGDFIVVRVTPSQPGPDVAEIDGTHWRVAVASDPVTKAPDISR